MAYGDPRYMFYLINRAIHHIDRLGYHWTRDRAKAENERLLIWGKLDSGEQKMEYVEDPDGEIAKLSIPPNPAAMHQYDQMP